jgi:hypothetical protein
LCYIGGIGIIARNAKTQPEPIMNAKALFPAVLLVLALPARAQDSPVKNDLSAPVDISKMRHWDNLLTAHPEAPTPPPTVGKSDYVFHAPLLEGLVPHRSTATGFGSKFLGFPIIRMLVPQRIAPPPGGTGRYFAWRDSTEPWSATAFRVGAGTPGGIDNPAFHEPWR